MNSTKRTFMFLGTAAGSLLLAFLVNLASAPKAVEGFSEIGQEFFPEFLDPLKATELSVVKYDSELKEPQSFAVKKNDQGFWVIPSHHDYPAEAAERLARTAASMIGIRKVAVQSRSKDDWGRYGVLQPTAEATVAADGTDPRGTQLALKDGSGNELVNLVIGRAVEGRDSHYYVRQPDKNTVFVAKLNVDLSTKFADWIEPDLLKVNQPDLSRILVNRYSVDEQQGTINQGEVLDFLKDKTSGKWGLDGLNAETEQVKEAALTDLVRNLDQLKIVGVRPKPQGLNADLTVSEEVAQNPLLRQVLQTDMQRQGYFVARGPQNSVQLVSNEGELIAGTTNGVRYTLYFGEIARGTAKDIEVGLKEQPAEGAAAEPAKEGETPADPASGPEKGPRRYLLVKVDYDEGLLGAKPEEPVAPEKPAILNDANAPVEPAAAGDKPAEPAEKPAEGAQKAEGDKPADPGCDEPQPKPDAADEPQATPAEPAEPAEPAAAAAPATPAATATQDPAAAEAPAAPVAPAADEPQPAPVDPKAEAQKAYDQALAEYEAAKAGHAAAVKAWDDRAKEGQKRVKELSQRFAGWYYVITAESFEKFQISRAVAVEAKSAEPAPGAAPGGAGLPGLNVPGLGAPIVPPGGGN